MVTEMRRPFSILAALLLALACLSTSAAQSAPPATGRVPAAHGPVPERLMSAVLDTAASPLAVDSLTYVEQKVIAVGNPWGAFGATLAISGDTALVGDTGQSKVYVLTRSGTVWSVQQTLTVSEGYCLGSVALSADGNTAVLGDPCHEVGGNEYAGSAYVFTRSGTTWTQQAELPAPTPAAGMWYGTSVAVSGDTALVGAPYNGYGGWAFVFTRSGTTWTLQATLEASAGDDRFGESVALAGNTALIGAPSNWSAFVFTRSGTSWSQQAELVASDSEPGDGFGQAVALSGDGSTALVGAFAHDVGPNWEQGAAYVFVRSGSTWTEQAQLVAADGAADDYFGRSVALSGNTALVGAQTWEWDTPDEEGEAYIFTRSGTAWTQQAKLTDPDGVTGHGFGSSVALSGDTALVGAPKHYSYLGGLAYVLTRSGTSWSEQARLNGAALAGAGDQFGRAVALSGDGSTALVGAYQSDAEGPDSGSIHLFTRSGTTWKARAYLVALDPWGDAGDAFGRSVALSEDGGLALVGAYHDDVGDNVDQGSVWVLDFVPDYQVWGRLTASDGASDDWFGVSAALSADGSTAIVGAYGDDVGTHTDQGSAYVFVWNGTDWIEQAHLVASDGASDDWFGISVAISGDTALVGAQYDDAGAQADQGSVYVFTRSGTTWSQSQKLIASDGAAGDRLGASVALLGDTALAGATLDDIGAHEDQGSAYVFTRSGATWSQSQKLTSSDGAVSDLFGRSVALSGDLAVVGASLADAGANTDAGAAYIFAHSGTVWSQRGRLTASDGAADDWLGTSVALAGTTALVGAPYDDIDANVDQGSAYFYEMTFSPGRVFLPLVVHNYDPNRSALTDPAGDWLPGADPLASADILAASAERRLGEGVMVFTMDLAGDLPETLPDEERNRWVWLLDTDMDPGTGGPWYDIGAEYEVNLHIQWDGFYVDVRDWNNNWTPVPGAGTIDGSTATLRIPIGYLGGATRFDWMVVAEPFNRPGTRFDIAPNSGHATLP